MNDDNGKPIIGLYNLNQLISASGDEQTRLSKFSFEYFITYSPDQNGYTDNPKLRFNSPDYTYTQTEILQILTLILYRSTILQQLKILNIQFLQIHLNLI